MPGTKKKPKAAPAGAVTVINGGPLKRPLVGAAARSVLASQGSKGMAAPQVKEEPEEEDTKDANEHPLSINHYIVVKYRDNSPRLAKILGVGGKDAKTWKYYVHYFDFNRRMDEWISIDRILVHPKEANTLGKQRTDAETAIHKKRLALNSDKDGKPAVAGSLAARPVSGAAAANKNKREFLLKQQAAAAAAAAVAQPATDKDAGGAGARKRKLEGEGGEAHAPAVGDDDDLAPGYSEEAVDGGGKENLVVNKGSGGGGNGLAGVVGARKTNGAGMLERKSSSLELMESLSLEDLEKSMRENRSSMLNLLAREGYSQSDFTIGEDFDHEQEQVSDNVGITNIEELTHDEHEGLDEELLREHEELTKIKNFNTVQLGRHVMECWYFSPFPKEYWENAPVDCIYFCEFTMRFFSSKEELVRFQTQPNLPRHPPGNEIYRDEEVSMFEVDGAVEKIYCQNLSYLAKLFLDHKTLFEDVDVFLFYVLCTHDERGYHPVGYFSKNKYSDAGYNLACILTFPSSQRRGFGKFLIAFSYELSKKESKVGSPEKPLSDLGYLSYSSYWAHVILTLLKREKVSTLSVMDISIKTSIVSSDVLQTLAMLDLIRDLDNGTSLLNCAPDNIDKLLRIYPAPALQCDPDKLHWVPLYVTDPNKDKWCIAAKN